ncbi:MAG: M48 family metallopeptidase [Syntrophales bacterium]
MIPYHPLVLVFSVLLVATCAMRRVLARINISHLRKFADRIPDVFRGEIDSETLSRMNRYTVDSSRLSSLESTVGDLVLIIVLLSGLVPWTVGLIDSLHLGPVASGLIFFMVLALAGSILEIPFDLYGTFVIEQKYGFSTITPGLWLSDLFKNLVISGLLMIALFTPLLALIQHAGKTWWLWAWIFFAVFQLFILWLYPIAISPLFNKFEPVKNEELRERIVSTAERAGITVSGVYQVDAAKRSRHTNAYFTGIGKTKRIVLYDTLLGAHSTAEILSVLAHEIGHWIKKHVRKQLIMIEVLSFISFYLTSLFLDWLPLYRAFGLEREVPYAGLFLLGVAVKPVLFFFTPIGAGISRRFERQADDYVFSLLGTTRPLIDALKRLAKENLANLHPHPFYAWFYYSHPPLADRIEHLWELEKAS